MAASEARDAPNVVTRLGDRVAIVTGAGSGIGKATALLLGREGAAVACADVDDQSAQATANQVAAAGGIALAYQVDVSRRPQVERLIETAVTRFKRLDIVVNCAGVLRPARILDLTEEDWDFVLSVNLKGTFLVCQAALRVMMPARRGTIVCLSSVSARTGGVRSGAAYVASKGGIVSLVKTLAQEGAPFGITVNAIAPGPIRTDLLRVYSAADIEAIRSGMLLGRFGEPEEVAQAALYLVSDAGRFITGTTLNISGGALLD